MLQIFTKDGCRTGSQRNSFLYADKEKKLPFILKKKDVIREIEEKALLGQN